MRNTKWVYREKNKANPNGKYSKDLLAILNSRNITTDEEIEIFLNGDINNLRDPYELQDMEKTVNILLEYREKNKNIWIYGDYDVDGITSTSLLYRAFKEIGININYYIPLRDEGYGLNKNAIQEIKNKGGDLIITVDCGISSIDEVNFANEIGIPIIITDHHEINNELPQALCVINVKREDNIYDFKSLAGVGTAYMVVMALFRKLGLEKEAYKYLDIVAIGTVADLVPLVEDNRIIVRLGLKQLNKTKWTGLIFLLRKLYEDYKNKKFDTYDIGFIIAPIFNAAGRLEDAKKSVELFINEDNKNCDIISYELMNQNEERKSVQNKIHEEVLREIEENNLDEKGIIIVGKEKFHHGVIGIVASKIVDKHYKPTIVMEIKREEGIGVASCRSIEGFSIVEALNSVKDILVKYGGHSGAAGFSIEISKIEEFKNRMEEYVNKTLTEEDFKKPVKIDKNINLFKVSYDFLDEISKLEPFGFGNPTPVFAIENCKFSNLRKIGKDQTHLMLNIIKDDIQINNSVWFGAADMFNYINESEKIDVACKLKTEVYRDRLQYKIFVEDIKKSLEKPINSVEKYIDLYDTTFPLKTIFYTRKKISGSVKLMFLENKVYITENKSTIGELDESISYILSSLKNEYRYNFKCEIKDIKETGENFNVYVEIKRDYSFSSYKLKNSEIFAEIKNYLIGKLPYNSYEKKVLASVFKENKNTVSNYNLGRGVSTIIKTIGLYYKSIGKKVLFIYNKDRISKEKIEILSEFLETALEYKPSYDMYIYFEKDIVSLEDKVLGLFKEEKRIENVNIVKDDFSIPTNIKLIKSEESLVDEIYWTKKLPENLKEELYEKYKNNDIIFGEDDVKILM